MTISRRRFLAAGIAAVGGAGAWPRRMHAMRLSGTAAVRRTCPEAWLPDPPSASHLRSLAAIAMDAARAAGADRADIRIGVQRRVRVDGYPSGPQVGWSAGYGIRAWRDRTWSFQHGNVLTPDAVASTARSAAAGARIYAAVNAQLAAHRRPARSPAMRGDAEWAPTPVVTGEWRVPVQIDPFTVPIDDYQRIIGALRDTIVPDGTWRNARALGYLLEWQDECRVFASTDGSLVTQHTICGGLGIQATAGLAGENNGVFLHAPDFSRVCAGFEVALQPEIPVRIQRLYDEAVRWRELPLRPFRDVGRFPVVLDGVTLADVIGHTLDPALDGDRVSGLEADASGGSFLSDPDAVLDASAPQFSPLLQLAVHRTLPSPMAVQWDDDGVVPESYTVVRDGRVTDFHTTRETAPMLAGWYRRQGRPVRSHGCAMAPTPEDVPRGTGGHLTVAAATTSATVDDLVRDVSHGFLVINGAGGATPGLTAGGITNRQDGVIVEIRRGVPVSRTGLRMQFITNTLLNKKLLALGDATTAGTMEVSSAKGIPWQEISQWVTSPAALCADVDVVL